MPNAIVDPSYTEEFPLKSLPPDGFVKLRRMTYGEYLQRRAMVAKMTVSSNKNSKDFEGEMALANKKVTELEFRLCIVDHNLEDENGNKLPLAQVATMDRIDPRVGEEISTLIDKMNQFELLDTNEEDGQGN
jgi:hypothetical protein